MYESALKQIKEAEEQAAVLCRVAEERATEMKNRIRAEGEAHCADVERNTRAEYTAQLNDIRTRATLLEEKKRAEAEEEARALLLSAREKMDEAVKAIVWGIVEHVSK